MKPKLLDVYCGAGLASIGYKRAGFHVTGIDIEKKSVYYGDEFIQADALDILNDIQFLRQFDAIHLSPPCQAFTPSTSMHRLKGKEYINHIEECKTLHLKLNAPIIIENVSNAPIRADIVLYGFMFGKGVIRKRIFQIDNFFMMQPGIPKRNGSVKSGDFVSVFGKAGYRKHSALPVGWKPKFQKKTILQTWHYAMGVEEYRFKDTEIAQGIPPDYTHYIGNQLISYITCNKHQ